jgi:hypothetical protein
MLLFNTHAFFIGYLQLMKGQCLILHFKVPHTELELSYKFGLKQNVVYEEKLCTLIASLILQIQRNNVTSALVALLLQSALHRQPNLLPAIVIT